MNKKFLNIVCIILALSLCGCKQSTEKYFSGKDTIESYGDGTYQLMHHREEQRLFNLKYNVCIIHYVDAILEYNGKIYATGEYPKTIKNTNEESIEILFRVYAVVDIQNNHLQFCAVIEDSYSMPNVELRVVTDEMISGGDATILESVTDFETEDWAVFQTIITGAD